MQAVATIRLYSTTMVAGYAESACGGVRMLDPIWRETSHVVIALEVSGVSWPATHPAAILLTVRPSLAI